MQRVQLLGRGWGMRGLWGSSPCTLEWAPPWALQVGTSLWELRVGGRSSRRRDHEAAHSAPTSGGRIWTWSCGGRMRCWACTASRTLRAGSRGSTALGTRVSSWPCTWRWSIPLCLAWQAMATWAHHCLHCTYLGSRWWALRAGQAVPGPHHGHVSAVSEAPGQFPWHHPSSEKSSYQSKGELATQGRKERWRCWWPWGLLLHCFFLPLWLKFITFTKFQ